MMRNLPNKVTKDILLAEVDECGFSQTYDFMYSEIPMIDLTWSFQSTRADLSPSQVCWLGLEPQGTPNHTFLPPNGSPSHHLGLQNWDLAQNSGPDLAVGVPGPESELCFHLSWTQMPKSKFSGRVSNLSATHSNGLGAPGAPSPLLWVADKFLSLIHI